MTTPQRIEQPTFEETWAYIVKKMNSKYPLRTVKLDGEYIIQLKCPGCGRWGSIDEDQLHGRVSIDCVDCDFHETVNIIKTKVNP